MLRRPVTVNVPIAHLALWGSIRSINVQSSLTHDASLVVAVHRTSSYRLRVQMHLTPSVKCVPSVQVLSSYLRTVQPVKTVSVRHVQSAKLMSLLPPPVLCLQILCVNLARSAQMGRLPLVRALTLVMHSVCPVHPVPPTSTLLQIALLTKTLSALFAPLARLENLSVQAVAPLKIHSVNLALYVNWAVSYQSNAVIPILFAPPALSAPLIQQNYGNVPLSTIPCVLDAHNVVLINLSYDHAPLAVIRCAQTAQPVRTKLSRWFLVQLPPTASVETVHHAAKGSSSSSIAVTQPTEFVRCVGRVVKTNFSLAHARLPITPSVRSAQVAAMGSL